MDKVLITVYVPSLGKNYELLVPIVLPLHEVISYISTAIEQFSEGQYHSSHKEILCTKEDGKILNMNYSIYELKIQNGTTLILI